MFLAAHCFRFDLLLRLVGLNLRSTDSGQERSGNRWYWQSTSQCRSGSCFASVDSQHGVVIRTNGGTFQRRSRERTFGTRIGENLRVKLPVGASGSVTPHRSGCSRAFPAELEFAGKQMLQALVIHHQHNQVDAFCAQVAELVARFPDAADYHPEPPL